MQPSKDQISALVALTLQEDIGDGDLTAALIDAATTTQARLICQQQAVLCGVAWADEVFRQVDSSIVLNWNAQDGDKLQPDQVVFEVFGNARSILTAERAAINLLQTLSGTASAANRYVSKLDGLPTQLLDTRKTIPGLRMAQKYAAKVGGAENHRMGLFDGVLLKENHIRSAGSISKAVRQAIEDTPRGILLAVEVESIAGMHEAIAAGAKWILLDHFSHAELAQAVAENHRQARLEASGNVTIESLRDIALTGVDYISVGALTKHLTAVDFSLQFTTF